MSGFQTSMQATVRVPQDGFTLDELKKHLRDTRIPAEARLIPTTVRDVDPLAAQAPPVYQTGEDGVAHETGNEIGFIAEWVQ